MDDHFKQILTNTSGSGQSSQRSFIPAQSFGGAKYGYFFGLGDKGLGYYQEDPLNSKASLHDSVSAT